MVSSAGETQFRQMSAAVAGFVAALSFDSLAISLSVFPQRQPAALTPLT
jgi:hypothetical protein